MRHTPAPTLITQPPRPGAVDAPSVNPFTEMSTNGIGFFVEARLIEEKSGETTAPSTDFGTDATSVTPAPDFLGLPVPNPAAPRSTQAWPVQAPAPVQTAAPAHTPAPVQTAAPVHTPAPVRTPAPVTVPTNSPARPAKPSGGTSPTQTPSPTVTGSPTASRFLKTPAPTATGSPTASQFLKTPAPTVTASPTPTTSPTQTPSPTVAASPSASRIGDSLADADGVVRRWPVRDPFPGADGDAERWPVHDPFADADGVAFPDSFADVDRVPVLDRRRRPLRRAGRIGDAGRFTARRPLAAAVSSRPSSVSKTPAPSDSLALAHTVFAPAAAPQVSAGAPRPSRDAAAAVQEFSPVPTMDVDPPEETIHTSMTPLVLRGRALAARLRTLAAPLSRLGGTGRWVLPLAAVAAVVIVGVAVLNARRSAQTTGPAPAAVAAPAVAAVPAPAAVPAAAAPAAVPAAAPAAAPAPSDIAGVAGKPMAVAAVVPRAEAPAAPEPTSPAARPSATAGCSADIESVPAAEVTVAGKALGLTPLRAVVVPCGDSQLSLEHPRYRRLTKTLHAVPDAPAQVSLRMQRPSAKLHLASSPAGAVFKVNGDTVGRGPRTLDVLRFETIRVEATLPGQKPWRRKIYVKAAETKLQASLAGGSRSRRR